MNPKTVKTSVWASAIGLLLGMAVMSPAGGFFLYALAALAALIPFTFGSGRLRVAGAIALLISLAMLAMTYQKFDAEMSRYKQRAKQKSSAGAKPAGPPGREGSQ